MNRLIFSTLLEKNTPKTRDLVLSHLLSCSILTCISLQQALPLINNNCRLIGSFIKEQGPNQKELQKVWTNINCRDDGGDGCGGGVVVVAVLLMLAVIAVSDGRRSVLKWLVGNFPGSPMAKTPHSYSQCQSLVRELDPVCRN